MGSSEIFVPICQITRRHVPKECNLNASYKPQICRSPVPEKIQSTWLYKVNENYHYNARSHLN